MPSAVDEVRAAWNDVGVNPAFHREMQLRLFREWPVLAQAVERLASRPPVPDESFQRGHAAGWQAGFEATKDEEAVRRAYEAGWAAGFNARKGERLFP